MRVLLFVFVMIAAIGAGYLVYWTISTGDNAIQQSSGFALACALVIIPYIFARSYQEIRRYFWEHDLPRSIGNEIVKANRRSQKITAGDS